MKNQNNKANKIQQQDNKNTTQIKTVFNYLQHNVATATMVFYATGIPQKCITRYKRDLEKLGQLAEVKRQRCKITNCWAWYLTTDVNLFPQSNQLKMF
jgi:predicted transcriptional regulator